MELALLITLSSLKPSLGNQITKLRCTHPIEYSSSNTIEMITDITSMSLKNFVTHRN